MGRSVAHTGLPLDSTEAAKTLCASVERGVRKRNGFSKRPSLSAAANPSKAPTTHGPTETYAASPPPSSACWSAPDTPASTKGDARGALELAEQAIALDQFHEASWRLALQAEHALGLRESITKRYDDLTQALDEQLGLQPTRKTRIMYRQLLGQG
jgi:Bacterial transcriptional activator domain